MPLVEIDNEVEIVYSVPESIMNLITEQFLIDFRDELYRINDYYCLENYADEGVLLNLSTGGWFAAFSKACLKNNLDEVLAYECVLRWYDSDIFDSEVTELIVEHGYMLPEFVDVAKKYHGDDIATKISYCVKCNKYYANEDVVDMSKDDEDFEIYSGFNDENQPKICKKCAGIKTVNTIDMPDNAIIISDFLGIAKDDLVACDECGQLVERKHSINKNGKVLCEYCGDKEDTEDKDTRATDYYRSCLKEFEDWKLSHTDYIEQIIQKYNIEKE